jgi:hypothetical protein
MLVEQEISEEDCWEIIKQETLKAANSEKHWDSI